MNSTVSIGMHATFDSHSIAMGRLRDSVSPNA